ncbi:MAG TPA: hypothetical protein PLK24_06400 [Atribacter sp.]|jgi:hypothetical protein|uniref:Uncharacterized protein n=1 Tax=Candidatus Atribacter allofermentans TaxID=1852833 RepID=A0A1V5SJ27_9BACT|nr:hypothetical protein [Atribacter sp.]MDD3714891.1 hypothetical protein [Atribacterota bacterium]OQA54465.1 MAG: hypothetical protein BWY41_02064 [Candidatus Atribacteria bacterium ADurb.Bin276]HHT09853.1 hypothetical protein [Candidatus Atribacteria bacterium]MDI9594206.1 hypothetical protein [Atribacterota bacterium]HQK83558.1 hypothetical protein [Atribacter sp.]
MDALKLAGLWKTRDRNGNVFLSGRLNTMNKILILPNTGKQKDEDPDYFFYIAPLKPRRPDGSRKKEGNPREIRRNVAQDNTQKNSEPAES